MSPVTCFILTFGRFGRRYKTYMTKEESSKVTRRSTKSSLTVTNPMNPTHLYQPRSQILDLTRLIGPLDSPALPIIIYGDASTCKTSVVLQMLKHLNRPFVYSSCRTCCNPRILFESILNQLSLHSKCSSNGYASAKRDATSHLISSTYLNKHLDPWGRRCILVSYSSLDCHQMCTTQTWDTLILYRFTSLSILKRNLTSSDLLEISTLQEIILCISRYRCFLYPLMFANAILLCVCQNSVVLRPFCRVTRRVEELSTTFSLLFRKYCEPLDDLGVSPNEDLKRRLYSSMLNGILLPVIFRVSSHPHDGERRQKASNSSEKSEELEVLDFHITFPIAVFLASRNPATLDASMFDSTGGMDNRKRKRKASEKSMEKKEIAEQEAAMKGPGSFPLERLLAIFQCIASIGDSSFNEEKKKLLENNNMMMSDILLQVSSLCDANFIIRSGSCPLEGSVRYRSMVSEGCKKPQLST
ncbi:hypothetical protein HID58_035595, partial [Brassica napus]